jgi:hypothetical protein
MRKILIGVVLFTAALPLTARAKSAQEAHANVSKRIRDWTDTPGHAWEDFD